MNSSKEKKLAVAIYLRAEWPCEIGMVRLGAAGVIHGYETTN